MTERVKSLAKRSGSKLSLSKGSVNHIGAAPMTYKIDVFISYVDAIKASGEFCVTWERRGKSLSTASVKVKDNKAVFREGLSMETTLFRKSSPKGGTDRAADGNFKFDEKVAKFALRKGNADGKAIGKMHLNLADHVKGTSGTVFADLKLSNGSIVVTKIESTLMCMGRRKKKGGADGDSEICSEMSEMDRGMENDSIFGDDANTDDLGDIDLMIDETGPESPATKSTNSKASRKNHGSKDESAGKNDSQEEKGKDSSSKKSKQSKLRKDDSSVGDDAHQEKGKESPKSAKKSKRKEEVELAESPSLRDKVRSKLKKEKPGGVKKEKGAADSSPKASSGSRTTSKPDAGGLKETADTSEVRKAIAELTEENKRLQTSRQAMKEEIEELRSELESCEEALEEASVEAPPTSRKLNKDGGKAEAKLRAEKKELQATVAELEGQIEGLLDELDGSEREEQSGKKDTSQEDYKKSIVDLELALQREPQYLDVVNQLKVSKMTLALANMEKEQAIFALRKMEAAQANTELSSPVSTASDAPEEAQNKPWGCVFG